MNLDTYIYRSFVMVLVIALTKKRRKKVVVIIYNSINLYELVNYI
jgi:hypothetical protein